MSDLLDDIEENPELYSNPDESSKQGAGSAGTPPPSSRQPRQETAAETHDTDSTSTSDIIGYLTAKGIRMELSMDESEISAYPDFNDSSARQWLKDHGFKWDGKAKCWQYR